MIQTLIRTRSLMLYQWSALRARHYIKCPQQRPVADPGLLIYTSVGNET